MKKYIIATGLLSLSVFVASAEGGRPQVQMMMPPVMTTGDATKDAQIKALQTEMEAKIKVIRDDYQARIKAIVGDSKPRVASTTPRRGVMMMRGSTTPPMMEREDHEGRDGGRDGMMRGSSTEPERMMMQGSTTRPRPNGETPRKPMVQNTESNGNVQPPQVPQAPQGFFSRFFGR